MTSSSTRLPRPSLGHALAVLAGLCVLTGSPVQAQNIDQGKSAPQLYAATCTTCHKNPGVLAKGRSGYALSSFLQDHYTASSSDARSLAAYLASVDAGPGQPRPARRAKRKPPADAPSAQPN